MVYLFDAISRVNKYFHADNEAIIGIYVAEILFMLITVVKRLYDVV